MNCSVRREGSVAVKSYAHCAQSGAVIARRAEALCRAGVTTPQASFNKQTNKLCSRWIEGPTGRGLFLSLPTITDANDITRHSELLTRAIEPLRELRALSPKGLKLSPLEPLAKIDPRLQQRAWLSSSLWQTACSCRADIADKWRQPDDAAVVHGDFHLGQIIFDQQTLKVWLLDLDDMTLGPAEFDLANFIAHFVTSRRYYDGDILAGFHAMVGLLADSEPAANINFDDQLLDLCGAASLLRRGLKLAARHESEAMIANCLDAASRLANQELLRQ